MSLRTITVLGRSVKYEITEVDVDKIQYYPENPRINSIISKYPKEKLTQETIGQELLKYDSTKERIQDIEANQGLIDEIYILNNVVVEGNTRLCAYKRLSQKYPNEPRWKKIKARVLPNDLSEEELFYLLGIHHIKGKTPWDAFEKAAYINRMINTLKKTPDDICKQFNIQKKTLEAMLKAYKVMADKFLRNTGDSNQVVGTRDDLKKFSYFDAFFHQKELVERADQTPEFIDNFVEWVKEERFRNAQSVRDLPKILASKKACKVFCDSEAEIAFEEAKQVLYEHKPEKVDPFYKKVREFRELIEKAELLKMKDDVLNNKNKKAELQRCFKELKKLCKSLGLITDNNEK